MKLNIAILLLLLSSISFNSFLFAQTISKEELIFLTVGMEGRTICRRKTKNSRCPPRKGEAYHD